MANSRKLIQIPDPDYTDGFLDLRVGYSNTGNSASSEPTPINQSELQSTPDQSATKASR